MGCPVFCFLKENVLWKDCRYVVSCRTIIGGPGALGPVPPLVTDLVSKPGSGCGCHPRLIQSPLVLRACVWGCLCVHARACVCGGPRGVFLCRPSQVRVSDPHRRPRYRVLVTHAPSAPLQPSPGTEGTRLCPGPCFCEEAAVKAVGTCPLGGALWVVCTCVCRFSRNCHLLS